MPLRARPAALRPARRRSPGDQGRLLACEIKAGDSRASLSRSARSFVDAYQPEQLLIVNRAVYPEIELGATRVRFLRIEELAAEVEGFLAADRVPPAVDLSEAYPSPEDAE